jgi:hypothetical protein
MRPILKEFRIYGPKNGLALNQDHHSLIRLSGVSQKSYLEKFLPLKDLARQYRKNVRVNAKLFLKNDFHMKAGLRNLTGSFYRSIIDDSPPPISTREILLTTKIMDKIFAQVYPKG